MNETERGNGSRLSRILGVVVGGGALVSLGAIVAIVAFFVMFDAAMVSWPVSAFFSVVTLSLLIVMIVRVRGTIRRSAIAALLLTMLGTAFLVPTWFSAFQHNVLMGRVETAVCSMEFNGVAIRACVASSVANPFNGNQCGYEVTLAVETDRSSGELEALLSDRASAGLGAIHDIEQIPPFIQAAADVGTFKATILFIGDEGSDLRCM